MIKNESKLNKYDNFPAKYYSTEQPSNLKGRLLNQLPFLRLAL
jgi:hypothetical protein